MPLEKALEMIRTDDRRTSVGAHPLPPTTNEALQNAERVAKAVYEIEPDLDSKKASLKNLTVLHEDEGRVMIEYSNEYGIFAFTCFPSGKFGFYQYMRCHRDSSLEEEDMEFSDKEIRQRLSRKRFPYEKKEVPAA